MAKKKPTKKPKNPDQLTKAQEKSLHQELIERLTALSTSGFGLVAALAWNSLIQSFVDTFIKPKVPGAGIVYQLIYALLITVLAVLITYQLSRISARLTRPK